MSRCEPSLVGVVSVCTPLWQDNVAAGYQDNPKDKKLLAVLSLSGSHPAGFSLVEGLIRYKNRIWLGHNQLAQQHVLQALHASGIGGHSDTQGT
jgi:hypothetical protein